MAEMMLLPAVAPWFGWSAEGIHILTFTTWRLAKTCRDEGKVEFISEASTTPHKCMMGNRAVTRVCYGTGTKDKYGTRK